MQSLVDVPQWYGVTLPHSFDFPSEEDLEETQRMSQTLRSYKVFESHMEHHHRKMVINYLECLFKEWLTEIFFVMNVPILVQDCVRGRVLPFGSFALGLNTKGSDLDLLCVGPDFIERQQFFTSFVKKLKAGDDVLIKQVIEDAFVPVIELTCYGIEVDLVYTKLNRGRITHRLNLSDCIYLCNMDIQSVRSLQGYRVTKEILHLIQNVHTFRGALTTIKLWAKSRNIYSNKLGFLGGVSWAILVARICQMHPNATAARVVARFFKVYSMWKWPIPILLRRPEALNLHFPVWDPRVNQNDRLHQMPIITPSYPHQNSAYNVTPSTLTVMKKEIKRGHSVMKEIFTNKATWGKLFRSSMFFHNYKHYIVVWATTVSKAQHREWSGFVESKLRHLVGILGKNEHISMACPNVGSFPSKSGLSTSWIIGVKLNSDRRKTLNLLSDVMWFIQTVYSKAQKSITEGMEVSADYADPVTLRCLLPSVGIPDVAQSSGESKKEAKGSNVKGEETTLPGKHKSGDDKAVAVSVKQQSSGQVHIKEHSSVADETSNSLETTTKENPGSSDLRTPKRCKEVSSPADHVTPIFTKRRKTPIITSEKDTNQ